jgi:hypothetical protein
MTREVWKREFGAWLRKNGIEHFSPTELCDVGRVGNGVALQAPPQSLWSNIKETLRCAEAIRTELRKTYPNAVLRVSSGYRDPKYNAANGGASNSMHVRFNAMDLEALESPGGKEIDPAIVQDIARALPMWAKMGIGSYPGFTHIDTRGVIGRSAPARW